MLICAVNRAPLVPIGSLSTCTITAWPSNNCFSMGFGAIGGWVVSASRWRLLILLIKSATCKNAARSRPMSIKADCMPGSTRATLPRYTLPTSPRSSVRSTCSSCNAPCSTTATRVSCGDQLIRMSCGMFCFVRCCQIWMPALCSSSAVSRRGRPMMPLKLPLIWRTCCAALP